MKRIKQREDDDAQAEDTKSVGSNSIRSEGAKSVASEKSSSIIIVMQRGYNNFNVKNKPSNNGIMHQRVQNLMPTINKKQPRIWLMRF